MIGRRSDLEWDSDDKELHRLLNSLVEEEIKADRAAADPVAIAQELSSITANTELRLPRAASSSRKDISIKIAVLGGFGAGKTTFVGSASDLPVMNTENPINPAELGEDGQLMLPGKVTSTVGMDFGRITLGTGIDVYLFGTPGLDRFWHLWDELLQGASAAVMLVDTRRLGESFASIDYLERRGLPFIIAVNDFGGGPQYDLADVRSALDIPRGTPIVRCDARVRESAVTVLTTLVEHVKTNEAR